MPRNRTSRVTPADALRQARRTWLRDQRIDMGVLARQLGISRATLYNWAGDRERLTGEVLWSIAERTIAQAREQAHGSGPEFIAEVIERYLQAFGRFEPARRFVARDPEFALRVLTCSRTPFQQRLIDTVAELIEEQARAAGYRPPLEPATLAYLLVRIGESFIFNDVITGTEPDLDKAVEASTVLLHAPPVVGSRRGAGGARQARLSRVRPSPAGARSGAR
jgi:AcrR family transcriptional regulator